ncbi:MAG: phosphogluconate dehydrogenase, partial [Actinomycetota bacterium]
MTTVGFLHPGSMGVTLAATIDAERLWVGAGRSPATAERAERAELIDAGSLDELCARSDVIVSICPPAAAGQVAHSVADCGFRGHYLDANAISPATSIAIGGLFGERYIDGGVIGPPAIRPGTTRLYLAGPGAADLATRWHGSALDARVVSDRWTSGAASALKMA